jgi:putative ABC transport system permease protein
MATILNVAGLSVAFAAFIVIFIQIRYERNFDKSYPTSDHIYRAELTEAEGMFQYLLPRPFIQDVIDSSPNIEAGTLLVYNMPMYLSTTINGEKTGFREPILGCFPDMVKVFGLTMVEGDPGCLKDPEKLIIPQSMARKLFGEESAIGKTIHLEEDLYFKKIPDFTIGGVYHDLPPNSQILNLIYTTIDAKHDANNYGECSYIFYLLLDNPSMADVVVENFNKNYDFKKAFYSQKEGLKLTPITDIYYLNEANAAIFFKNGNREMTFILFCIAILIIIVAIINFTNFSTALTPIRIKSINIQKVLGSSDTLLRRTLTMESVIISLASWIIGLAIVLILDKLQYLSFLDADLNLLSNMPVVLLSGLVALITGIIAGVYPAWYMVSFPPALALKGSFGLSASGRKMRTALIGIQFVVSIMLIVGSGFIWLQNDYMKKFSMGFDKDQIAIVELSGEMYEKHKDTYVSRLKDYAGIEDVAFSRQKLGTQDLYSTSTIKYKDKESLYLLIWASHNLLDVLGIPVTEGRNFTPADEQNKESTFIFNRTAQMNNDMDLGDQFCSWMPGRIAGFTGDVKFTSLRQGEDNLAFIVNNSPSLPYRISYIRMKAGTNVHEAVSHIRKTIKEIDPVYPFEIEFYDKLYDNLYRSEVNLRSIITLFSLIAIVISLVGVFGLVVFETQYRRKEIAVRRVHGSTIREILSRLNQYYVYIVCVCFVFATPIAYVVIQKWLESFVYKTPVHWWLYAIAFVIVLLIIIATVTFQSWRAATANPVDSLKSE